MNTPPSNQIVSKCCGKPRKQYWRGTSQWEWACSNCLCSFIPKESEKEEEVYCNICKDPKCDGCGVGRRIRLYSSPEKEECSCGKFSIYESGHRFGGKPCLADEYTQSEKEIIKKIISPSQEKKKCVVCDKDWKAKVAGQPLPLCEKHEKEILFSQEKEEIGFIVTQKGNEKPIVKKYCKNSKHTFVGTAQFVVCTVCGFQPYSPSQESTVEEKSDCKGELHGFHCKCSPPVQGEKDSNK